MAVALGVALAWSVHLINTSALQEFAAAVRSANGQADAVVRGARDGFDEAVLDRLAADPAVLATSPVVEVDTYARAADGSRVAVKLLGIDLFSVAAFAPDLMPRPHDAVDNRLAPLDPQRVFANAAAQERLSLSLGLSNAQAQVALQSGPSWLQRQWSGDVAAGGEPLLVADIAGVQAGFGMVGRLSRVDLKLAPGATPRTLEALVQALQPLAPGLSLPAVEDSQQRVSNMSRAYRVNLTVLALVALFVGSFLVYSVTALSVAQRTPQWALLGILGLPSAQRMQWVLLESAILGAAGSAMGLALGTVLAQAAMKWLAGDLGGGVLGTAAATPPPLVCQAWAPWAFGGLGVLAAVVGAWVPSRHAQRIQPAQAIKGLGAASSAGQSPAVPLALCALGSVLAFVPPIYELPLAAYASVAAWLFGGVGLVPWAIGALLQRAPRPAGALPLLALERAQAQRHTATAAVAGVVASLALCVALTVMVASFREGVSQWLDAVLPADLYARTAQTSALAEQAWLPPEFVTKVAALPGVRRVQAARTRALSFETGRPSVALIARELGPDASAALPFVAAPKRAGPQEIGVYVSEAMVALYGARVGTELILPLEQPLRVRVLGVWRDYARQFGTIAIDAAAYRAHTADQRINDLALWLEPSADLGAIQTALRSAAPDPAMLDFASTAELRRISLGIFDRSFAVTRYLQLVAIAIGLLGIAASLSAQVLARRKEFGLLAHLGVTRRQVIALVVLENAAWLLAGVLVGLCLGAVISVVLVHVVNPQSFHWTMELVWPQARLAALAAAVMAAGMVTAAWSARHAAGRSAVLAVKEDW